MVAKFENIYHRVMNNKNISSGDIHNANEIIAYIKEHDCKEFIDSWNIMLKYQWSSHVLKRLDRLGLLEWFLPDVAVLKSISQNKRKTVDALQHTLKVLNEADKRDLSLLIKWAAIFHDIGKAHCENNFHYHEYKSEFMIDGILDKFPVVRGENRLKLYKLVRYHMWPLGYQRNQNYTDKTIENFIKKISDINLCIDIVDLAICDKLATHNRQEYISPLLELKSKIWDIHERTKTVQTA